MSKEALEIQGDVTYRDYVLTADVNVGDVIPIGTGHIGIAGVTALLGETISIAVSGLWEIAAATADVIALGDQLYFDPTARNLTIVATSMITAGTAFGTKPAATAGSVYVSLNW